MGKAEFGDTNHKTRDAQLTTLNSESFFFNPMPSAPCPMLYALTPDQPPAERLKLKNRRLHGNRSMRHKL